MTTVMVPKRFDAPPINPSPNGLDAATIWQDSAEPLRWLPEGLEVRPWNYGYEGGFGVWSAAWCASEADLTDADRKLPGVRPDPLAPFLAVTTWASDECDMREESRAETRIRAQQIHRFKEPITVEGAFAERMLDDAGTPAASGDLVEAVSKLEDAFAVTNTLGFVHARAGWLPYAAQAQLLVRSGSVLKTPGGHQWVFGGGYVAGLGDTLVATSQPFGFRQPVQVDEGITRARDGFQVIVERSLVVGYEATIGAVTVTP